MQAYDELYEEQAPQVPITSIQISSPTPYVTVKPIFNITPDSTNDTSNYSTSDSTNDSTSDSSKTLPDKLIINVSKKLTFSIDELIKK